MKMISVFTLMVLCVAASSALAQDPTKEAELKKLGVFPSAGTLNDKNKWCQKAIVFNYGRYDPSVRQWTILSTTAQRFRDSCVRNNGQF